MALAEVKEGLTRLKDGELGEFPLLVSCFGAAEGFLGGGKEVTGDGIGLGVSGGEGSIGAVELNAQAALEAHLCLSIGMAEGGGAMNIALVFIEEGPGNLNAEDKGALTVGFVEVAPAREDFEVRDGAGFFQIKGGLVASTLGLECGEGGICGELRQEGCIRRQVRTQGKRTHRLKVFGFGCIAPEAGEFRFGARIGAPRRLQFKVLLSHRKLRAGRFHFRGKGGLDEALRFGGARFGELDLFLAEGKVFRGKEGVDEGGTHAGLDFEAEDFGIPEGLGMLSLGELDPARALLRGLEGLAQGQGEFHGLHPAHRAAAEEVAPFSRDNRVGRATRLLDLPHGGLGLRGIFREGGMFAQGPLQRVVIAECYLR